ncbi:MAG TPA: HepT-like ribonuclease domain-containing protein, partial [Candidatus Brocadiales bacterium]|nr:HepT-like ribonuclease domain-containing protein [Candidatus Brocadiales bacterium]
CQDAVIRRIEIVGEAARRISEETQNGFPGLPWNEIIGMRNVMIHEYDDVDLAIVWETVKNDLPPLIESLEDILKQ